MAFAEDFDNFIETDGFAVAATWTPAGGEPVSVKGIFDDEYFDETGAEISIEGDKPIFHCAVADVSGIAVDDTLTLTKVGDTSETTYNIVDYQPDGTGQILIILEEQ